MRLDLLCLMSAGFIMNLLMSDYDTVLLEDMNHKLDSLLEGQTAMGHMPRKLDEIDDRLCRVESDVGAIKLVLKDHSRILNEHSRDIAELKQAVA